MKRTHSRLRSSLRGWRLCITISFVLFSVTSPRAQSLTNFRIANGTSGENPAVLWVGAEQGFYRKHGLNVETIYMRVGSLAASALASGDVNAVLTSSNAVLNLAAGGLDVVIIASLFQRPEGDFMARPEFKRPEDLKGKLIAIQSIGGGGWANNMLALDYLGLDPDRDGIRFIVLGDQPSRIQALETGRAQASWMGSTFSAPLKKKGYTLAAGLEPRADPLCRLVPGRQEGHGAPGAENLRRVAEGNHRCPEVLSEAGKQARRAQDHGQTSTAEPSRRRGNRLQRNARSLQQRFQTQT